MYTQFNFKTKKELKTAVARRLELLEQDANDPLHVERELVAEFNRLDRNLRIFQPGPFGGNEPQNGTVYLEGPHYPQPHKWYAEAEVKDGVVVKVK